MKSARKLLLLTVLLFIVASLLPCFAQRTGAQNTGTDFVTHKFQPKGPVGADVSTATASQTSNAGISESALAQIRALMQDKATRTPVQKKIDPQLILTARMMQNQPAVAGLQYIGTDVDLDQNDNFVVDITAEVTSDLLKQMTAAGAKILYSDARYRSIRATVPPTELERVASLPGVVYVSKMQEAYTQRIERTGNANLNYAATAARNDKLRNFLSAALTAQPSLRTLGAATNAFNSGQGSQASEGDVTHRAFEVRNAFGIDGTGLKIGVLSDGVSNLAASQALGDLGPVTVLPGQTGTGDEGTAMLEIVHDLAPGAQLYFATAMTSSTSFAQNIRDLRTAGCDIIVDDVGYYSESPFQDGQASGIASSSNGGVIAQAVNDVTADGALYFSSAGNSGGLDWGTSGVWEGDFVNGGTLAIEGGDPLNQFGANVYDTIAYGSAKPITLFWSDPLGGPANDFDLYVLNSAGTAIVAASYADQSIAGTDPYEAVSGTYNVTNNRIVVALYSGSPRYLHLNTNRGELAVATEGQTHGHNSGTEAFGVAAAPALEPFYEGLPLGPFPNYFSSADLTEAFSSDGPRRLFFQGDGTPYTPGNFSHTGGIVRQKPDITAADGVSVTGVGGFGSPFYGTSAAAPHAAAIAALIKSAGPTLTNAQIRSTLINTAIDILDPGVERDSGAGILDAFEAVRSLGITGVANPDIASVTATDNPGNENGIVEAGEGGKLVIQLRNTGGVVDATNISATLTTTTPGVTITQPNTSAFANLPALTGTGTNQSPFTFTLASNYPCGQDIDFTLSLTYAGGPSPTRDLNFKVSTELPPVNIGEVLDTTAPVVAPPLTGATGSQNLRLYRNGAASVCGTAKTFPGTSGSGTRQFDSYTFTACSSGCATITTTAPNTNLYTSMYSPAFNPSDISTGFAGDTGSSSTTTQFGVSTVAGTSYTVVVNEVNQGGGIGTNYNVQISGCVVNCAPPNQLPIAVAHDVTVTIASSSYTAAASIDNGSSDPDGDAITLTQTPPGPYPIGVTPVTLTVVDTKGAAAQATANVTVQDVPVSAAVATGLAWTTSVSSTRTIGTITHTIGQASDFTATIAWGDGTTNSGTVTGTAPSFTVTGTHTYAAAGSYTVTLTIQDVHGGTATQTGTVTVSTASFGFTSGVSSITMVQGQTVSTVLTITPNPAPFNAAITLACGSNIAMGGCSVSPTSVTPGNNPVNVTLTVRTSGQYVSELRHNSPIYASLMFSGLGLIGLVAIGRRKSSRRMRLIIAAILLSIAVIGLVNCGGGATSNVNVTAPGTYNVTVTATSGTINHSYSTTVTVTKP